MLRQFERAIVIIHRIGLYASATDTSREADRLQNQQHNGRECGKGTDQDTIFKGCKVSIIPITAGITMYMDNKALQKMIGLALNK